MYTISDNSPSAGYIAWAGLHMAYLGTTYTITDGNTNNMYVWWDHAAPTTLKASNTLPTNLTDADCLLFLNKNGIHLTIPTATVLDGDLLVPGSVVAGALAANSVTSTALAADSVTATAIATGSVTADAIAANAVTANAVAANAIGANAIAANAISASNIQSGTITATQIAAGTITSASGVIGALDAGAITTGTLNAARIGASSITADKILIGDFTNLYRNAQLLGNGAGWSISGGSGSFISDSSSSAHAQLVITSGEVSLHNGRANVNPGDLIVFSFYAWLDSTSVTPTGGNFGIYGSWYKADGTYISGGFGVGGTPTTSLASTETLYQGSAITVPANAYQAEFYVYVNGTVGTKMNVRNPSMIKQTPATLIQNGAITTNKIASGAITSTQIASNTITASNIATNTITATQIAGNTITSSQIASRTITADRIVTGAITANEIASSTITTNQIAANTITGGDIASATITATNIAAGTITASQIAGSTITADLLKIGMGEQGGYVYNAGLSHWSGTYPDGASIWSSGGISKQVVDSSNVAQFDCSTGGTQYGMTLNSSFFANGVNLDGLKYFCLELKFRLTSGTSASGASYLVDLHRVDGSYDRLQLNCSDAGSTLTTNTWYTVRKVFQLSDTSVAKTFSYLAGYLLANWSGAGDAVKTIQFMSLNMYPATLQDYNSQTWTYGGTTLINGGQIQANTITASQLVAGTITAASGVIASATITGALIASGTITSANIANATIVSADIASATITGANIANATITASNIVNATITNAQIASGTITSANIQDATITNTEIANATIQYGKIASVDASTISVGTLSASRIGANTITSDKLLIGDFTNLLNNPSYNGDANGWTNTGYVSTDGYLLNGCQTFINGGSTFNLNVIQCQPGDQFYVSVWYKTGTPYSGAGGLRICTDASGSTDITSSDFVQNTAWTQKELTFTIPSGKTQFAVGLKFAMTGTCWVDNWECRRISESVLIQDGAITTNKMIANSINGDRISAGTITADKLQANTITAVSGVIASIDAGKITTGTLDASKITVTNLSASSITTGTLSGRTITGGTISGTTISGSTITSTNSNSNLTISGASLIGTINGKQGLVIGDHSVGFQDWANAGAVAAGMFLSYGSDLTNGNTTGLCIGTAKGYLGFGKEAADGSSISSDFLINYGYNPGGVLEKFIYYGDFNMKGYNIYNAGWITCNDYDLGIGSGYSGAGTLRNILRIQKGTGKFTLAGDQSSDQWSDFYGNINFHGWTQAHMQLDHKTIVVGSDGWLIRGGGISDLTFVNGTSPYIQVTREIVGGQEAWGVATWLSDISLKNNIADSSINALELVKSIRHRQFIWNDSGRIQKLGYVAQELQQLEDSLVLKITQPDGRVFMQPNETVIIPYLSKAIQELSAKIDYLQQQITELQVKQAS